MSKKLTKAEMTELRAMHERAMEHAQDVSFLYPVCNGAAPEPLPAASVTDTLAERGARYGDFTDHANISQDLQDVMRNAVTKGTGYKEADGYYHGWDILSAVQKQALTVIADKIARILSGDPYYADNWHDIQGYAKLVEDRL